MKVVYSVQLWSSSGRESSNGKSATCTVLPHSLLEGCLKSSGLDGKESACSAGDPTSIPGLGRFPGKGNGNPLQFSCLENSMHRRI